MKKSKGNTLIASLLFIMMIVVLGSILLELSLIGMQTATAVSRAERLRYAAEAGVERGIQLLKESGGKVPSSPNNVLSYSSPDGQLNYRVELYKKDPLYPYNEMYYITSKVSTSCGRYNKQYAVRIDKSSFKSNFFTDSLCGGGLIVIGQKNECFEIAETGRVKFLSPLYVQGKDIKLPLSRIDEHRTIAVSGETLSIDKAPSDKYLVYADISEESLKSLTTSYNGFINGCRLDFYGGINIRDIVSEDRIASEDVAVFKRNSGGIIYLSNIDTAWQSMKSSMALSTPAIDSALWSKLSSEEKLQVSSLVKENTTYKLVIVKGHLLVTEGEYSNYLICCSGNITISGKVQMINSSIMCSRFIAEEGSDITISCPSRTKMASTRTLVEKEMKEAMKNYTDGVTVRFISWYDM